MIPAHIAVALHELRERNRVATDLLDGAGHHLRPTLADSGTQTAQHLHGCVRAALKKKGLRDDEKLLTAVKQVLR